MTDQTDWARTWKLGAGEDMRTPAEWMARALKLEAAIGKIHWALHSMNGAQETVRQCQMVTRELLDQ